MKNLVGTYEVFQEWPLIDINSSWHWLPTDYIAVNCDQNLDKQLTFPT